VNADTHAPRSCDQCGSPIALPSARFCDPCRSLARRKRVKWVATETIDTMLRRIYAERCDSRSSELPGLKEYAARIGWPHSALKQRARKLGLARTKETPWLPVELRTLQTYAWMCDARIRLKLKAHGFHRTETAIHLKLTRTRAKQNLPYYTAQSLAECFGIDVHTIMRWLRRGLLKGKRRETARTEIQGGDMWLIHERDVRHFLLTSPAEYDLRKVEKFWFLDLITEGKVAA
jgi:hypothetical protein